MKVEVSIGEAIDKLSILEIKDKNITDINKKIEIQKEINELGECIRYKQKYLFLYNLLIYINQKVWNLTDIMKTMNVNDDQFSNVSLAIFENNSIISLGVLPIGSTDITNDIALGLKIPLEQAEDVKTGHSSVEYPKKKLYQII